MSRLWAVLLAAAIFVGCRSSQPTPNPFLRTTVPPPATGTAVVVPSEPYYSGSTAPAPAVTVGPPPPGAPVVAPPPGAPVMAPPPVVAPPPAAPPPYVVPPKSKFDPPGGSYQYNQSSTGKPQWAPTLAAAPQTAPAAATQPAPAAATQPAPAAATQPATTPAVVTASYSQPAAAAPVQLASYSTAGKPGNQIRILPANGGAGASTDESVAEEEGEDEEVDAPVTTPQRPVIRMAVHEEAEETAPVSETRRASATTKVASTKTAKQPIDDEEIEPAAAVTTPAPVDPKQYNFTADYSQLRGRLEYSPTARQWKLRYIPIDGPTDGHGGSVILADSPAIAAFKPGDMVTVRGSLAGKPAANSYAPLYQPSQIAPTAL